MDKIVETTKNQKVIFEQLDLVDLSSVRSFSQRFLEKFNRLDILINNAGIAMSPYSKTKDGFESQIQTNHLGLVLLNFFYQFVNLIFISRTFFADKSFIGNNKKVSSKPNN